MNHSALAHKPLARLLFVLACTLALCPAQPVRHAGFSVKDGVLLRDGKPYRAMGINVASLADDILAKGQAATESFAAIEYLGQKKIPFIRFCDRILLGAGLSTIVVARKPHTHANTLNYGTVSAASRPVEPVPV